MHLTCRFLSPAYQGMPATQLALVLSGRFLQSARATSIPSLFITPLLGGGSTHSAFAACLPAYQYFDCIWPGWGED